MRPPIDALFGLAHLRNTDDMEAILKWLDSWIEYNHNRLDTAASHEVQNLQGQQLALKKIVGAAKSALEQIHKRNTAKTLA